MRVDVILHQTVVFLVAHLRCQEQVPTFKSAFKDQRSIFLVLKFVASAPIPTVFDKASIAQLVKGLWLARVDVCLQSTLRSDYRLWKVISHLFSRFSLSDQFFDIKVIFVVKDIFLCQLVNALVEIVQQLDVSQIHDVLN